MGAVSGHNPGFLRLASAVLLTAVCSAGCAVEDEIHVERHYQEAVVSDFFSSGCSTSVVIGLSYQIADEVGCLAPDTLVPFEETDGIVFAGSAVIPYLTPQAKEDLLAAAAAYGDELRINSGYRTVAQQYLLRKWYELGRCGITAAALPGNSNHESGRALDIGNYGTWSGRLPAYSWQQTVPGDAVHFDHLDSPDLRGSDVLAFQRLWNRNHPGDLIGEDGDYGPQTDARLAMSPAEGFPLGSICGPEDFDGALVATDVPEVIAAGDRVVAWVEVENTGATTWQPDQTFLGTTGPKDRDSDLFDQDNWISPSRPTGVDAPTAPGQVGRFSFMAHAPELAQDATLSEQFGLVQEGVTWFGPMNITINVSIDADDGEDPAPPDDLDGDGVDDGPGENEPDTAPVVLGGCSTGGGAGSPLAVLLAILLLCSRRRAPVAGDCWPATVLHDIMARKGIAMGTGDALLSWQVTAGGSRTTVVFEGEIVEQADFHELQGKLIGDLEFDMRGVRRVNSAGAHRWVEFVRSLPSAARLAFVHCSPAVVLQVNLIHGFIGGGAVRSFYAPYCCDRCDGQHFELLLSRDVRKAGWLAPEFDCPDCKVPMAFDDDPLRYFAFTRPDL